MITVFIFCGNLQPVLCSCLIIGYCCASDKKTIEASLTSVIWITLCDVWHCCDFVCYSFFSTHVKVFKFLSYYILHLADVTNMLVSDHVFVRCSLLFSHSASIIAQPYQYYLCIQHTASKPSESAFLVIRLSDNSTLIYPFIFLFCRIDPPIRLSMLLAPYCMLYYSSFLRSSWLEVLLMTVKGIRCQMYYFHSFILHTTLSWIFRCRISDTHARVTCSCYILTLPRHLAVTVNINFLNLFFRGIEWSSTCWCAIAKLLSLGWWIL